MSSEERQGRPWVERSVVVLLALLAGTLLAGPDAWSTTTDDELSRLEQQMDAGAELYATACVSCHGADGRGVEDNGPTLFGEGAASVDFVMRTGRMPLSDPELRPIRGPVRYSDDEIRSLVAYVDQLTEGTGAAIPSPDVASGNIAEGGALFRSYCAACHQAAGQGGSLENAQIPSLSLSTPTQVAEAMLIGPGEMPVFTQLDEEEVDDITAYVNRLQVGDDPGGFGVGRTGPFAEGLVAWGVGLLGLMLVARWIGTRMS